MPFTTLLLTAIAAIVVLVVATLIVRRFWGVSTIEPTLFDPQSTPSQPSPTPPHQPSPTPPHQPPSAVSSNQQPSSAATLTKEQEARIRELLAENHKIEAIKQVRVFTGLGLAEAKRWVERAERRIFSEPTRSSSGFDSPIASGPANVYSDPDPPLADVATDSEVQTMLARGNKIAAIKRVRELSGVGLKEAKDYVDALVTRKAPLPPAVAVRTQSNLDDVASLAASGRKIEAIKRYRELTGVGLKEAKDYVDRLNVKRET